MATTKAYFKEYNKKRRSNPAFCEVERAWQRKYAKERYKQNRAFFQEEGRKRMAEKRLDADWKEKDRVRRKARRATIRLYERRRYAVDLQFRLGKLLRGRLKSAIRNGAKTGSAVKLLGVSVAEAIKRIEERFKPGMTWSNWGYGSEKWHIDHIQPLSRFNLSDPEQLALACHIDNLQPLWQTENLQKRCKVECS